MRFTTPLLLAVATATATLGAAELQYTDLRAGIGVGIGPDEVDGRYAAGPYSANPSSSGDIDLDREGTGRLQTGIVHGRSGRYGGWYVGGALQLEAGRLDIGQHPSDKHFDDTSFTTARVALEAGYVYAITPRLTIEAGPTAGIGVLSVTWVDQQSDGRWKNDTGAGYSTAWGGRIGGHLKVTDRIVIGLSGGWEESRGKADVDFDEGSEGEWTIRTRSSGPFALLEAGIRL